MSDGGDREGEIVAGLATEVEITQKRSEGRDQLLRRWNSTLAGTFQKKVAYGLSIPLADIVAERFNQVGSTSRVLPKCWFFRSAMRLKPATEGGHECWLGALIVIRLDPANPTADKMPVKEFDSKMGVIARLPTAVGMRASAAGKMTTKGIKSTDIDVRQKFASLLNKATQVGGSPKVSNGAGPGVSVAFKIVRE